MVPTSEKVWSFEFVHRSTETDMTYLSFTSVRLSICFYRKVSCKNAIHRSASLMDGNQYSL